MTNHGDKIKWAMWLVGIFGSSLSLAACEAIPLESIQNGTDLERSFLAANVEAGTVLFQDDFEDPSSGWPQIDDPGGRLGYDEGAYRIEILRPDWYYWGAPAFLFEDVHIETIISKRQPSSLSLYGIICRYQDEENFYFGAVTSDGYFGISRFIDGQESLLGMDTMQFSPAILQGVGTNYLRLDCVGDRIGLTVNGQPLFLARDATLPSGKVGLIASLLEGDAERIEVDIISVMKP